MRVVFCSATMEEAESLARELVQRRLAACVQVIPAIKSFYHWEGECCEDEESLLLIKTEESVLAELTTAIKELHSYTVPEIVSVVVEENQGNVDYLEWVKVEVAKKSD